MKPGLFSFPSAALPCLAGIPGSAFAATPQGTTYAPPAAIPPVAPVAPATSPAASGGAQSANSSVLSGLPDVNLSWSGYFEALAILCFILALILAVLWLFRRRGGAGGLFTQATPGMRVESRLALGPKKWLLVVRYLDRRLVLGVTEENIRLLTELYDEDVPAQPQAKPDAFPGPARVVPPENGVTAETGEPQTGDPDLQRAFASVFKKSRNPAEE